MAGYKTISMGLLVVLVALAGISPVFGLPPSTISFDPPAACPGETVTIRANIPLGEVVGGGISIAAVSPLDAFPVVLSSDPAGLIVNPVCTVQDTPVECTFQVSESATCGGHYTVTLTLVVDTSNPSVSGPFDVAGPCCAAVGGCVQPVNTFALVSPWLVAIGLIGCIGTVVVAAKKRDPQAFKA